MASNTTDNYIVPIGLDFGTQNSCCVAIPKGSSVPIPLKSKGGESLHRTAVYYHEQSETGCITGKNAIDMISSKNAIVNVKRALGVSNKAIQKKKLESSFNADLADRNPTQTAAFEVKIDGKIVTKTPIQVATDFLKDIQKMVDSLYGENVGYVVSAPEQWNLAQNRALQTALSNAGIKPLVTLSEPAAAQMGYKANRKSDAKQFLVSDLGGGTSDTTMMKEIEEGKYETFLAGGDSFLGSKDVDILLLADLKQEMMKISTFDLNKFQSQESHLMQKMREVKHKISELPSVTEVVFGVCDEPFTYSIDQEKKERILRPFYDKFAKCLEDLFENKAKKLPGEYSAEQLKASVEEVYLVGGGMRDPYFGEKILAQMFPNAEIVGKYGMPGYINPDEVVAMGCAYYAASQMKMKLPMGMGLPPGALHMRVLSQDFGIETVSISEKTGKEMSWFHSILDEQSVVPTIREKLGFTTSEDNQAECKIRIFQGKGNLTTDDGVEEIGSFDVPIHPVNKVGEPKVDVEFEFTKENCLIVRAGERGKQRKEITVNLNEKEMGGDKKDKEGDEEAMEGDE